MWTYAIHLYSFLGVVRLIGGNEPYKGRLEVYYNAEWGTVCDDGFDISDANVVCRELGYLGAVEYSYYGQGSGSIWLDDLACTGTETSIYNCAHSGFGNHSCGHNEDVGVECQGIIMICTSTRT